LLTERRETQRKAFVAPAFAIVNRELLRVQGLPNGESASVVALSPSDGTFKQSLKWISTLIPSPGDAQRRVANITPNTTSVVLWITAGRNAVLLGADLEHRKDANVGWLAVLASRQQMDHARMFKIPHHGSANADCPEVWTDMLEENPISIVTPFAPSGLPREADTHRLLSRTSNLYCTSAGRRKPPKRELVDKLLKGVERYALDDRLGHVRIRSPLQAEGPLRLELFNGAFKL
jgi:hypothetical protein